MLTAKVKIVGVRPILFHKFGPDAIPLDGRKEKTGVAGNNPEEWKKTHSTTKDGQLYIEPSYIFGCLREGAKYTKSGRGSIQKSVAATLQVIDDIVLIDRFVTDELTQDRDQPVYIDVRSVVLKATGGRHVRYRLACSPGWSATFNILWDQTIVDRHQMHQTVIDSGKLVGLADARQIGFGRFEVEEFAINEYSPNGELTHA